MNSSNILIIFLAEVSVLLLIVSVLLVFQNRSLRLLISKLRERAQELVKEIKQLRSKSGVEEPSNSGEQSQIASSYLDHVEKQIELTLAHHKSLNSNQNIALDIDPEVPLPHRAAALRHAMLTAELEAMKGGPDVAEPDWRSLRTKYEQIFSFYEDFGSDEPLPEDNADELEAVKDELSNARQRIANLEKFKRLYLELEEKWQDSRQEVQSRYQDLSDIASKLEDGGQIEKAIQEYHESYDGVTQILQDYSIVDGDLQHNGQDNNTTAEEVKRLRAVAADQHKIIEGLQEKLRTAKNAEERTEIVEGLQGELQKQRRFVQESETCIQLLEDELTAANNEIDALKAKSSRMAEAKAELHNLRKQHDGLDLKYHTTLTENRKLQKKLNEANRTTRIENPKESIKLRKQLNEMEAKYNELEEKFLDLKLQQ